MATNDNEMKMLREHYASVMQGVAIDPTLADNMMMEDGYMQLEWVWRPTAKLRYAVTGNNIDVVYPSLKQMMLGMKEMRHEIAKIEATQDAWIYKLTTKQGVECRMEISEWC